MTVSELIKKLQVMERSGRGPDEIDMVAAQTDIYGFYQPITDVWVSDITKKVVLG